MGLKETLEDINNNYKKFQIEIDNYFGDAGIRVMRIKDEMVSDFKIMEDKDDFSPPAGRVSDCKWLSDFLMDTILTKVARANVEIKIVRDINMVLHNWNANTINSKRILRNCKAVDQITEDFWTMKDATRILQMYNNRALRLLKIEPPSWKLTRSYLKTCIKDKLE